MNEKKSGKKFSDLRISDLPISGISLFFFFLFFLERSTKSLPPTYDDKVCRSPPRTPSWRPSEHPYGDYYTPPGASFQQQYHPYQGSPFGAHPHSNLRSFPPEDSAVPGEPTIGILTNTVTTNTPTRGEHRHIQLSWRSTHLRNHAGAHAKRSDPSLPT